MTRDDFTPPPDPRWNEDPWNEPSEWYLYRCQTCDYVEWIEDIVFDAFPPAGPRDGPILGCPECNGERRWDRDTPTKRSWQRPRLPEAT